MKKQNLKSLSLKRNTVSHFNATEIKGGRITWLNAECATMTCPPSEKCVPATVEGC